MLPRFVMTNQASSQHSVELWAPRPTELLLTLPRYINTAIADIAVWALAARFCCQYCKHGYRQNNFDRRCLLKWWGFNYLKTYCATFGWRLLLWLTCEETMRTYHLLERIKHQVVFFCVILSSAVTNRPRSTVSLTFSNRMFNMRYFNWGIATALW